MSVKHFIFALALLPLPAFCQIDSSVKVIQHLSTPTPKYTIEKFHSNENDLTSLGIKSTRTIDVPTQIIRTSGDLHGLNIPCDDVTKFIDDKVLMPFMVEDFTYNAYVGCSYDPDTNFATHFTINTYFDPLTDDAVAFLNTYLDKSNGMDIFGTPLKVEPAKGLLIAINIMSGFIKNPNKPPLSLFRQDRSNFSFKSNFEMRNQLITDLYDNFYSDDNNKILPFLDRWIYPDAGISYYYVLTDANYVELQPERIFIMDNNGDIFVSKLRYYFAHLCYKHDHHHCLKRA